MGWVWAIRRCSAKVTSACLKTEKPFDCTDIEFVVQPYADSRLTARRLRRCVVILMAHSMCLLVSCV